MSLTGVVEVFVGGGQPGHFKGGLTAHSVISTSAHLDTCKK